MGENKKEESFDINKKVEDLPIEEFEDDFKEESSKKEEVKEIKKSIWKKWL